MYMELDNRILTCSDLAFLFSVRNIDLKTKSSFDRLNNIINDNEKLSELISEDPKIFTAAEKAKIESYLSTSAKSTSE